MQEIYSRQAVFFPVYTHFSDVLKRERTGFSQSSTNTSESKMAWNTTHWESSYSLCASRSLQFAWSYIRYMSSNYSNLLLRTWNVASQQGDVDLAKNVDATGESSMRRLVHRDKVRYPSATLVSEIDWRPAARLCRTLPVSINDVYQVRIIGLDVGSLPYCTRKFRCTWVSDFVSMNQTTH
ncbi:hypothetical protein AVEN_81045-1 [Araneus ventricosus]|uniref:Uncharacterized protein n=1 Tax=Araneus ventricosus TaxID=182803 RepID=A0A4Y2JSK1_ARAVE|nr:hypothetical protein AVEN_81045-1 [Araneus ventricosus]